MDGFVNASSLWERLVDSDSSYGRNGSVSIKLSSSIAVGPLDWMVSFVIACGESGRDDFFSLAACGSFRGTASELTDLWLLPTPTGGFGKAKMEPWPSNPGEVYV